MFQWPQMVDNDGIVIFGHPSLPEISIPLWNVANRVGIRTAVIDGKEELVIDCAHADEYLLVATLAQRLANEDIVILDMKDTLGKRAYMRKLMSEMARSWGAEIDDDDEGWDL